MDLTRIIQTNFSNAQLIWIIVSIISGLISIFLFLKQKTTYSLFFLFLSGTILRFLAADLDHFLYTWDEQYHALVAKNMMTNPFKPMLIVNPVLDYDPNNWVSNHIWVHKQPWFLWQIALFFKLFGVSELVLRTPTAIMFSILILVIYRIGSLTSTKRVAWFGAFLYTFSFYFLNIVTGMQYADHNDVAFIFYIALSIWAWLEYVRCRKRKWVLAIGIFVGIAILNKWLVGLLVYSGWIISVLINSGKGERSKEFKNIGIALAFTILIALPWQVYISLSFPLESKIEFAFNNSRHFFEALDGHSGPTWYHFHLLSTQYGGFLVYFVILPGLIYLLKSIRKPAVITAFITFLTVTYSFFTIVQTRMPLYCAIVSPIIFLALGAFLDKVIQKVQEWAPSRFSNWIILPFLGILLYMNLDINKVDEWHSCKNESWYVKNMNAIIDKEITPRTVPGMVIFNSGYQNAAMLMFYSGLTAYSKYPDTRQYKQLKKRNIKMATFAGKNIPSYLADDPSVIKFYMTPLNVPLSAKNRYSKKKQIIFRNSFSCSSEKNKNNCDVDVNGNLTYFFAKKYSPGLVRKYNNITNQSSMLLSASIKVYINEVIDSKSLKLIISREENEKIYEYYTSSNIGTNAIKPGIWNEISVSGIVSKTNEDDEIKIYLWNPEMKRIGIKDLEVSFIEK